MMFNSIIVLNSDAFFEATVKVNIFFSTKLVSRLSRCTTDFSKRIPAQVEPITRNDSLLRCGGSDYCPGSLGGCCHLPGDEWQQHSRFAGREWSSSRFGALLMQELGVFIWSNLIRSSRVSWQFFCLSYIFMWESCLWLHFELKEDSTGKVSFKVRKGSPMGHLVPAVAAYNSQGVHPCLQHHDFHPFAPLG